MIHLLRKIRANFVQQNRFTKYLIYALGEIVLVVIGIMLALYFNNLNTLKENKSKERWYLLNIVEDLEYQKVILEDMRDHVEETIIIGKELIKDFNIINSFSETEELNEKLNLLLEIYNFPNTNNTYQELVSSGQLGLITNKTLSVDIINFYLESDLNFNDIKSNNDNIFYREIYPIIKKYCQIELYNEDIKVDEKSLLKTSLELEKHILKELEKPGAKLALVNALKARLNILGEHLILAKETIILNAKLVESIDDYLGIKTKN